VILENFLLIVALGILLVYFFSSMSVYKSLYHKVNEEKDMIVNDNSKYQELISRYEKQVKAHASTLKSSQDNLQVARNDLQEVRLENTEYKHKIETLETRNEELYAQVNTLV